MYRCHVARCSFVTSASRSACRTAPLLPLLLLETSPRGPPRGQVVGNAYTAAEVRHPTVAAAAQAGGGGSGDDEHDVWIEIGLRARQKDVRMRCVFQYGPGLGGSGEKGVEGAGAASAPAPTTPGSMVIRRVFLVREGLDRLPPQDAKIEVSNTHSTRGGKRTLFLEGEGDASFRCLPFC